MSADEGAEASKMSPTNGELLPSTSDYHALATPGKRKRGSAEEKSQESSFSATESQDKEELQENLQNLVEILSKCALPIGPWMMVVVVVVVLYDLRCS